MNKAKALIIKLLKILLLPFRAFLAVLGWVLTQIGKESKEGKETSKQLSRDFQKEFLELLPRAAQLYPLTWCVKNQAAVTTSHLWALRCWECPEFVLNEGVCDPL